jgi:hypothetical protein
MISISIIIIIVVVVMIIIIPLRQCCSSYHPRQQDRCSSHHPRQQDQTRRAGTSSTTVRLQCQNSEASGRLTGSKVIGKLVI